MDSLEQSIIDLENKGVFIPLGYDHYKDGTNCIWALDFRDHGRHTSWYGDNHEFGNTVECLKAAIRFANWMLEGDNMEWFFYNAKETVTEEGHKNWIKHHEREKEGHKIVFNNH